MKIHSLQAIRAFAALLVVIDHALLEISKNDPASPLTHLGWALGNGGVYAFFVISGFIMVHISWESFGRKNAAANFLRRRFIRIVPLYWMATAVALAYHRVSATHGARAGLSELACSFAFIPYKGNDGAWGPILPQGWTLNYEIMFYLVFAASLFLSRRIALAAVALALVGLIVFGPLLGSEAVAYLASPIILWFLLGMALAVIWRWRGWQEPGWLARSTGFLEPLGDASYSTYLVHGLILTMLLRLWIVLAGPPSLWLVPVSVLVALIAGWVTYRMFERPILSVTQNLSKPSGRAAVA